MRSESRHGALTAARDMTAFSIEWSRAAFLILLTLAASVRLANIHYNTLFLDEAIYATVGKEVLTQVFDQRATSWMFGSYLYPVTSALAGMVGGVTAIRLWSIALNMMAIVAVYLAATRLFDRTTGFVAALLFAFNGQNISLAQQAVYDGMSVTFLAAAFALGTYAVTTTNRRHLIYYLLGMGFVFTLSVLGKYISLLYIPALYGTVYAYRLQKTRSLSRYFMEGEWIYPLLPLILIFGTYSAIFFSDLKLVFSGQYASQPVARTAVIREIVENIGLLSVLALAGMGIVGVKLYRQLWPETLARRLAYVVLALAVFLSYWVLPLYHIYSSNARALGKHEVFALVFLAPFAAYGLTRLATARAFPAGSKKRRLSDAVRLITIAGIIQVNGWIGLRQHHAFQYSWPDATGIIALLEQQPVTPDTRILGSAAAIYEYYLNMPPDTTRSIWTNIWYVDLFGLEGAEAIRVAIETCQFDYIITDDYYSPEIDRLIGEALSTSANYELVYSDTQTLRIDAIITSEVYTLRENNRCDTGASDIDPFSSLSF